jgi:hypothetical protein
VLLSAGRRAKLTPSKVFSMLGLLVPQGATDPEQTSTPDPRLGHSNESTAGVGAGRWGAKPMLQVGLKVMSALLLPLVCGSCATQSGILYGSKIELEAGRGRGNESKTKVDEVGLFFSGKFGLIELGQGTVPRMSGQAPYRHTAFLTGIPLHAVGTAGSKRRENHEGRSRCK